MHNHFTHGTCVVSYPSFIGEKTLKTTVSKMISIDELRRFLLDIDELFIVANMYVKPINSEE